MFQLAIVPRDSGASTHVDHDSLLAHLVERKRGIDGAPIEFDGAANAVDTASKDDDTMVVEGNVVGGGVIRGLNSELVNVPDNPS